MTIPQMIKYISNTHVSMADHEMLREYILRYRNDNPYDPENEDRLEEFAIDDIEIFCESAERVQELIETEEEHAHNNENHPAHEAVKAHYNMCSYRKGLAARLELNQLLLGIITNQL